MRGRQSDRKAINHKPSFIKLQALIYQNIQVFYPFYYSLPIDHFIQICNLGIEKFIPGHLPRRGFNTRRLDSIKFFFDACCEVLYLSPTIALLILTVLGNCSIRL